MKKILPFIVSAPLSLLLLGGCEDFLNMYPPDEVSSNLVYASADMAESAVTGVYNNNLYDYVNTDLSRLNWDAFAGVIDPYYECYYANYSFLNGNTQPNAGFFLTYWKRLYEGVNRANDVIENIVSVPDMSDEIKNCRIAECKFLRAYCYYKLNSLWRGVPIYDRNLAPAEYRKPRSSEEAVWDFIIGDLTDCINCTSLPDKYAASSSDFGRVTKGAAYALRGKVYMWKKQWGLAEADLLQVGACGYALLSDKPYADVFKLANETCSEMVFSARMVEISGFGNVFSNTYGSWQVTGGGNNTFYMNRAFVDSYQCADGSEFDWDNFIPGYNAMSEKARSVYFLRDGLTEAEKNAMASYGADMSKYLPAGNEARIKAVYEARDPRLLATVITPYSVYNGGYYGSATNYTRRWPFRNDTAPDNDLKTKANNNYFYCIRKFVTVGLECLNKAYNPVDVPIIRYAQVLIDLAECVNEQGRPAIALGYLNDMRKRAGVAQYPVAGTPDQETVRANIVRERRWELACEEVLYYDELRQGTWKDFRFSAGNGLSEPWGTIVYTEHWGGDQYMRWAIPSSEIQKNTNLLQNDGWKY